MKRYEIRVDPENHHKYNPDPDQSPFFTDSKEFKECLDVHNDVIRYFEDVFESDKEDWGGEYASFLEKLGINSNSENGWFSKEAVDPKNIQAFVEYVTEGSDFWYKAGKVLDMIDEAKKSGVSIKPQKKGNAYDNVENLYYFLANL